MSEILPCPNPECGGACELIDLAAEDGASLLNRWAVHCRSCHRVLSGFSDPVAAIAAHNTIARAAARAEAAEARVAVLEAQVSRLRAILEDVQASISTCRDGFLIVSVARGVFEGAFMGEGERIADALAATVPTGENTK